MPLRFRGRLVAGDMGCRETQKPRGGAVYGWETSVDRWGTTPGLLGANNGRLKMADLSFFCADGRKEIDGEQKH